MNASRARGLAVGFTAAALAIPATASAARVHVRVEGAKRTQVPDIVVKTNPRRTVGLGAHPTCSGGSALGALDAATRGDWAGSYFDGLGYSPERILRERHTFDSGDYYAFYVNNRPSDLGVCGYTPKAADHLLFGLAGATAKGFPGVLAVRAPRRTRVGRTFSVRVVAYPEKGKPAPVAHAKLRVGGAALTTGTSGTVRLVAKRRGRLTIRADKQGFIRSEPATVRVTTAAK